MGEDKKTWRFKVEDIGDGMRRVTLELEADICPRSYEGKEAIDEAAAFMFVNRRALISAGHREPIHPTRKGRVRHFLQDAEALRRSTEGMRGEELEEAARRLADSGQGGVLLERIELGDAEEPEVH